MTNILLFDRFDSIGPFIQFFEKSCRGKPDSATTNMKIMVMVRNKKIRNKHMIKYVYIRFMFEDIFRFYQATPSLLI